MNFLRRLKNDDAGFITSTDLILVSTIVVIGMIVGLTTLRDQVVQELGDLAVAIGHLDQSYSFGAATIVVNGATITVAGSNFVDTSDACELGTGECNPDNDPENAEPACIELDVAARPEGV